MFEGSEKQKARSHHSNTRKQKPFDKKISLSLSFFSFFFCGSYYHFALSMLCCCCCSCHFSGSAESFAWYVCAVLMRNLQETRLRFTVYTPNYYSFLLNSIRCDCVLSLSLSLTQYHCFLSDAGMLVCSDDVFAAAVHPIMAPFAECSERNG